MESNKPTIETTDERFSPDQPRDTSRDLKFNPALTIEPEKLEALVSEIDADLNPLRSRKRAGIYQQDHERRLGAVVANGLEGTRLAKPLFYPARATSYRGDVPPWLTQYSQPRLIKSLTKAGYLDGVIGKADPNCGQQSTYTFTGKAQRLCSELKVDTASIIISPQDHRSIVLKDHNKQLLRPDYLDANVAMRRRNTDLLNEFILTWDITYVDKEGNLQRPPKTLMSRIYNQCSMYRGGRFFRAFWHLLKSNIRKSIRINGEATEELDFGSMHARMAYHKLEREAPLDCYTFQELISAAEQQGLEYKGVRNKTKKLANMGFNAPHPIRFYDAKFAKLDTYTIEQVDTLLWEYHDPISQFKFSDAGLGFMNTESDIAEDIMIAGMHRNIPILPVHDSFRVRLGDMSWLEEQMHRSYYVNLRYNPVVTLSK